MAEDKNKVVGRAEDKKEVIGRAEGIVSIILAVAAFVLGLLAQ